MSAQQDSDTALVSNGITPICTIDVLTPEAIVILSDQRDQPGDTSGDAGCVIFSQLTRGSQSKLSVSALPPRLLAGEYSDTIAIEIAPN